MKKLDGHGLKAFLILSVVAPVSILTTLRLTGILKEPPIITETITLETMIWNLERPNQFVYIDSKLDNAYVRDGLSSTMCFLIGVYSENLQSGASSDYLSLGMVINATVQSQSGYVYAANIFLHKDHESTVDWLTTELHFENLSLADRADGYRWDSKAYISLKSVKHFSGAYLSAAALWLLFTTNNQSHRMEATYEVTYFNGTAHKKVIQPFQLDVIGGEKG